MDSLILANMIGLAVALVFGTALFGFFLQGGCGVVLLGSGAAIASGLCIAGAVLAGWIGLVLAVALVALLTFLVGRKLGGLRGAWFLGLMWLGLCASCAIGYWIGGGVGLLAIPLPAIILFWITLYVFSGFVLPLDDSTPRHLAFRSLLTFALGTNFPYHVMNDRTLEERAKGSPYKAFFGGPGIVITGCDHVAVITDGTRVQVPKKPGLAFTHRFEVIQRTIDLRPQLRSFHVEARTLDGIPIRVLAFVPFRIHWGGQKPALGSSFPFQRRAILQAVTSEIVEQQQDRKHDWDELVEIHANRILRDIVCEYRFDDLCLAMGPHAPGAGDMATRYADDERPFPHSPALDPRYRIRDEMVARLKTELRPCGVEVIGGGISNLLPKDDKLIKQRIANWRAKWQNRIKRVEADRDARRVAVIEPSRVGINQTLMLTLAKMLSESVAQEEDISDELIAATFIASLERMADNTSVRDLLPKDFRSKMVFLRSMGRPLSLAAPSASDTEQ
jgi:hypothetical protein